MVFRKNSGVISMSKTNSGGVKCRRQRCRSRLLQSSLVCVLGIQSRGREMNKTNIWQIPMGFEWCRASTRHRSAQTMHGVLILRGALGRRHPINVLGYVDRQRSMLRFHDRDFCLARECRRLRFIRKMASLGADGGLLGAAVWHAGHPGSEPVASGHGDVCRCIYCLRCDAGLLCSGVSQASSVHAPCTQSARRAEGEED